MLRCGHCGRKLHVAYSGAKGNVDGIGRIGVVGIQQADHLTACDSQALIQGVVEVRIALADHCRLRIARENVQGAVRRNANQNEVLDRWTVGLSCDAIEGSADGGDAI